MFRSRIRAFGQLAAGIGLVCLLALSTAILCDAFMRSAFNKPIFGLSDFVEIVTPVIVAACLPLALFERQNITIRFLGRALPARAGQVVELFGNLVALLVIIGIAWELGRYTAGILANDQHTWLLRIPVGPSWTLASTLIVLCIPVQALVCLETWADLRRGRALESSEESIGHEVDEVV